MQHTAHVNADKGRNGDGVADGELSPNSENAKRVEDDVSTKEQAASATDNLDLGRRPLSSVVKREGTEKPLRLSRLVETLLVLTPTLVRLLMPILVLGNAALVEV